MWTPRFALAALLLAAGALASCSDDDQDVDAGDRSGDETDGGSSDTVPGSVPDLVGEITAVTPFEPITEDCVPPEGLDPDEPVSNEDPPVCTPGDHDVVGTVLVEEQPGTQEGRKISYTVTAQTTIAGTDADGEVVTSLDDLAVGQPVDTWVAGDACAESYPEQCGALAIRVTAGSTGS